MYIYKYAYAFYAEGSSRLTVATGTSHAISFVSAVKDITIFYNGRFNHSQTDHSLSIEDISDEFETLPTFARLFHEGYEHPDGCTCIEQDIESERTETFGDTMHAITETRCVDCGTRYRRTVIYRLTELSDEVIELR